MWELAIKRMQSKFPTLYEVHTQQSLIHTRQALVYAHLKSEQKKSAQPQIHKFWPIFMELGKNIILLSRLSSNKISLIKLKYGFFL